MGNEEQQNDQQTQGKVQGSEKPVIIEFEKGEIVRVEFPPETNDVLVGHGVCYIKRIGNCYYHCCVVGGVEDCRLLFCVGQVVVFSSGSRPCCLHKDRIRLSFKGGQITKASLPPKKDNLINPVCYIKRIGNCYYHCCVVGGVEDCRLLFCL